MRSLSLCAMRSCQRPFVWGRTRPRWHQPTVLLFRRLFILPSSLFRRWRGSWAIWPWCSASWSSSPRFVEKTICASPAVMRSMHRCSVCTCICGMLAFSLSLPPSLPPFPPSLPSLPPSPPSLPAPLPLPLPLYSLLSLSLSLSISISISHDTCLSLCVCWAFTPTAYSRLGRLWLPSLSER
jgi:hypothetical protein